MWPGTANSGGWRSPQASAGTPQQHAGTGAIRQEKIPTDEGWDFGFWGGDYRIALITD